MAEEQTLAEVLREPEPYTAGSVTIRPRKLRLADAEAAFGAYASLLAILTQVVGREPTAEDAETAMGYVVADLYASDPESRPEVAKLLGLLSDATEETLARLETVDDLAGLWSACFRANSRPFGQRTSAYAPVAKRIVALMNVSLPPPSTPPESIPETPDSPGSTLSS